MIENGKLVLPLTRKERDELKDLSFRAYGMPNKWLKLLNKPEYREETGVSGSGNTIAYKRAVWRTLQEIKDEMEKIVTDQNSKPTETSPSVEGVEEMQ